jgi:hypothetical protein
MGIGWQVVDAVQLESSAHMLDPTHIPSDFSPVENPAIKVLGQLRKTPWQRFARLQRTAATLARGRGQPKGVFRFSSHEACDAWTANLNRNGK